jgi:hypothetical protein
MSDNENDTFIGNGPIFPPGHLAGPSDSMKILAAGGPEVQKQIQLTGADKFEHMLLYCLKLLSQCKSICAFYTSDFDDCDETTLRIIQRLISRSGYIVSDYNEGKKKPVYKGFWAWRPK